MSEPSYLCSECGAECDPQVTPDIEPRSGDVHPSCHRRAEVLQGDAWCAGPLKVNERGHSICETCWRWTTEPRHHSPITLDQWDELVEAYWKESDILDAENKSGLNWRE